jgi:DNA repair exonuclease SbcCD ATPase subunit
MKLKKMSFRNFKSYSNVLTEISFDDTSSLNLIIGENGTGKTSIAECATYLLYGKLENFTSADIPNRINKAFYGKIELDCDGHNVIIERGLNPGLFKVQIDDEVIDTAGKLNVQSMLEENYFKIPYSVFHNILVLEVDEVKSLLSMSASDKRNIIDKICGFTIYNKYKEFAKSDLKTIDDKLNANIASIRTINANLIQYDRQIEEIKNNSVTQEELEELVQKINEAKSIRAKNDDMLRKLRAAGDQIKTVNYKKVSDYNLLKNKVQEIEKKIAFIDRGKCPTCGSSLETEDFQKMREGLVTKKGEIERQMEQIKEIINGAKPKLIALEKKEKEITADNYKIPLADLQSDYKYKATLKERGTSAVEGLKIKLMSDLEVLNNEKTLLEKEKTLVDFLALMFSDTGGIKRYIANHYVPIINDLMKNMMDYMDLNYTITFNDNFDAEIIQNGMKIKYATLSKGQKARVDFATIISFVKFLKLQFGELNLLFLDELFSHVDINGMNDMIDILRNLSNDMNLNIYLIHHAKLENVMFDRVLQTKMTDGFSRIEYL